MKSTLNVCIFLTVFFNCYAQTESISKMGFYIPKDINECNQQLDKVLTKKAKTKFKQVTENQLNWIHGFFIFSQWFESDSTRLANYFNQLSVVGWQERDFLILLSYHRQLNQKAFDINFESGILSRKRDSLTSLRKAECDINLVADSIDGFFIPSDLTSCFLQLDKLLDDTIKQDLKSKQTKMDLIDYHMGLGRWMRNIWGLWNCSRLKAYFENKKVSHPDDMSGIILAGYWNYLNGKFVNEDSLIMNTIREAEEVPPTIINATSPEFIDITKYYSKEYKRFLRTRKIKKFEISN